MGFSLKKGSGDVSPVVEAFSGNDLGAVDFTNPKAIAWWQSKLENSIIWEFPYLRPILVNKHPLRQSTMMDGLGLKCIISIRYCTIERLLRCPRRNLVVGWFGDRSAYAGSQRYPVQWGGDSYSTLDQLSCQVRALIGYGLSGIPFCSHDVGGFDYSPHFFDDTYNVDFKNPIMIRSKILTPKMLKYTSVGYKLVSSLPHPGAWQTSPRTLDLW